MKYEIYQRQDNQHRAGHFGFLIEGVEAEITVEPAQFLEKALREVTAEGVTDPAKHAIAVQERCDEYARRAIQRRIDRLQNGTVPAGVDIGKRNTNGVNAGTAGELAKRKRTPETRAVEVFLNRGKLRGLDKDARKKRSAWQKATYDNNADWRQRRLALIKAREADLAYWQTEHANGNPKAPRNIAALKTELAGLTAPVLAASHGFQYAYTQYLTKAINLASDDIRIWPLMTNTTLDTVRDAVDTFSDVTADEFDGSGYSSGGLALDSQAVAVDDANDRAEFDSADEVVTALGAGTRSIQGVALGLFVTNTAASLPLHWIEFASNKTPDGSDFTFVFNAEGILQAADG